MFVNYNSQRERDKAAEDKGHCQSATEGTAVPQKELQTGLLWHATSEPPGQHSAIPPHTPLTHYSATESPTRRTQPEGPGDTERSPGPHMPLLPRISSAQDHTSWVITAPPSWVPTVFKMWIIGSLRSPCPAGHSLPSLPKEQSVPRSTLAYTLLCVCSWDLVDLEVG